MRSASHGRQTIMFRVHRSFLSEARWSYSKAQEDSLYPPVSYGGKSEVLSRTLGRLER